MSKDSLLKGLLSSKVLMTLEGGSADDLTPEEFKKNHGIFFDGIIEISKSDISEIQGYGELDDNLGTKYDSFQEFAVESFNDKLDGYWYQWREIFHTTIVKEEFFEQYYDKMLKLIPYSEGYRYLTYNNAFFENLIINQGVAIGFPDWSRAAIMDWIVDIVILDLNKPYLRIPELLFKYCNEIGIRIDNFKERFLGIAYYKGLDVLRWHASIDDVESCESIMTSIVELESRIMNIV